MVIRQGEVFWVELGTPTGSGPGFRRPHVVVQNDILNRSPISTTVVCALTSNLQRAKARGNVLLNRGEAGPRKRSVVNISQVSTVDKSQLVRKIGTLSASRTEEVLRGLYLLLEPMDVDET